MEKLIEPNRIYTVPEAADLLGVNPRHVKKMIREGKLSARKIGHGYKILGQAIVETLKE